MNFRLLIYGSGSMMASPSTPNVIQYADGSLHLAIGSTELNECVPSNPFSCETVVRVRQLRAHDELLDVDSSAIWDEVVCRMLFLKTSRPSEYGAQCEAAKAPFRARYYKLKASARGH